MTKMTQKMAIAYVIDNCDVPVEVLEKLEAMKATLERKSAATGNRKPTATQVANEGHKQVILDSMDPDRLYTITEMTKEFDFGTEVSVNKCSALIRQLVQAGAVERVEDKRKAYFKLA